MGQGEPRYIPFALAIGDLFFAPVGLGLQKLRRQSLGDNRWRRLSVNVDQAPPQLAMLQGDDATHPPQRRLGHSHHFSGGKLLGIACDHPEPRRNPIVHGERLDQVQKCT